MMTAGVLIQRAKLGWVASILSVRSQILYIIIRDQKRSTAFILLANQLKPRPHRYKPNREKRRWSNAGMKQMESHADIIARLLWSC
ncbi:hypothetical protein K504DRAFT_463491 [Pleomassaria siparia CBS 279.74]|uniref:Uncharacterized protein n=1 Tax=Pleomassaria siparia CBS 279.74 TaxID=1314801 RepID=A0A6G1JTD0_9PLEO|nr:hypothetical protein K504DRAFT_463491 [Pleomassaria siparia CBS 279.74]